MKAVGPSELRACKAAASKSLLRHLRQSLGCEASKSKARVIRVSGTHVTQYSTYKDDRVTGLFVEVESFLTHC